MARPQKELSNEEKAQVEALAAFLSAEQIADYLGVGRTTFYAMMDRDNEISERYKRGRAKAVGSVAQGLLKEARNGNLGAMIFYLKTQAGWRETNNVEISGQDGGPIRIARELSEDDLLAIASGSRDNGG